MSGVVAFAGPSVPVNARTTWPDVTWLPPAQAGDFLRLIGQGVRAVALIDGYFDHCPATWHKEVLAVMAEGIIVAGASSMGALRAAELDQYGMVGVGSIYRAYRNGLLTGDDEVALVHAPERLGWTPLSVPMVDVRATLVLALRHRILDRTEARRLREAAHGIYFVDRDWPRLSKCWLELGTNEALVKWLNRHHVKLKRLDAEICLNLIVSGAVKSSLAAAVPQTIFLKKLQSATLESAASASAKK